MGKGEWTFAYPNGVVSHTLRVPAEFPVRLDARSLDVTHRLVVPELDIEHSIPPGRVTEIHLKLFPLGEFRLIDSASSVPAGAPSPTSLVVMFGSEFESWYVAEQDIQRPWTILPTSAAWQPWLEAAVAATRRGEKPPSGAAFLARHGSAYPELAALDWSNTVDAGRRIWRSSCNGCHSDDGSPRIGPTHAGLWQRVVAGKTRFRGGRLLAEHIGPGKAYASPPDYIRDQLKNPTSFIVQGFPPTMPSFAQVLEEEEIEALIAFFILGAP